MIKPNRGNPSRWLSGKRKLIARRRETDFSWLSSERARGQACNIKKNTPTTISTVCLSFLFRWSRCVTTNATHFYRSTELSMSLHVSDHVSRFSSRSVRSLHGRHMTSLKNLINIVPPLTYDLRKLYIHIEAPRDLLKLCYCWSDRVSF